VAVVKQPHEAHAASEEKYTREAQRAPDRQRSAHASRAAFRRRLSVYEPLPFPAFAKEGRTPPAQPGRYAAKRHAREGARRQNAQALPYQTSGMPLFTGSDKMFPQRPPSTTPAVVRRAACAGAGCRPSRKRRRSRQRARTRGMMGTSKVKRPSRIASRDGVSAAPLRLCRQTGEPVMRQPRVHAEMSPACPKPSLPRQQQSYPPEDYSPVLRAISAAARAMMPQHTAQGSRH